MMITGLKEGSLETMILERVVLKVLSLKRGIKKRNGTDIKPPPIPKSPAKKPTGIAAMTIKIIK